PSKWPNACARWQPRHRRNGSANPKKSPVSSPSSPPPTPPTSPVRKSPSTAAYLNQATTPTGAAPPHQPSPAAKNSPDRGPPPKFPDDRGILPNPPFGLM